MTPYLCFSRLRVAFLVVITLAMGGCATAPAVSVPREVDLPVASCPVVVLEPEPIEEPLTSRAPDDVSRTAQIRLEQWKSYARRLEVLLAPFTQKTPPKAAP